jgi:predicted DCC family thiol-disulfide oxidoreductase YuxK
VLSHSLFLSFLNENYSNAWVDILLRLDVNGQYKMAPLQSSAGRTLLKAVGRSPDDISSYEYSSIYILCLNVTLKLTFVFFRSLSIDRVVLVKRGKNGTKDNLECYVKSQCVLKVVEGLNLPAALASQAAETLVPMFFRDFIYDTVAENRYRLMGKRDECRCGDPEYADRFLS